MVTPEAHLEVKGDAIDCCGLSAVREGLQTILLIAIGISAMVGCVHYLIDRSFMLFEN